MPGLVNELLMREIEQELKEAPFIFFGRFSGFKVLDFQELRQSLAPAGRRCLVVKNAIARGALKKLGYDGASAMLDGMSCVMTAAEEPQRISKILVNFSKGHEESFQLRGAMLDGRAVSLDYIKHLASLPGKQELQAAVVGTMKAPITNFVLGLRGVLQSLVFVLEAASRKPDTESK